MHKRFVKERNQQICLKQKGYYLERRYPAFGNLPRDIASRAAKERCDAGFGLTKQAKRFI
jgi:succinate dehydrogenase / fumarate reductase flavoprotein subunit